MLAVIVLVILALIYNFLNGFNDSSNIVATIISSRALPPRLALWMTALAEFFGPFIFGVAVARTIGVGLISPSVIQMDVIVAALASAIIWGAAAWFFAIPSSSTHALVGGLIGAAVVSAGWGAVQYSGLLKIIIALFVSPILGLAVGFLFTRIVFWLARNASPRINHFFMNGQIITGLGLGLSYGANDAQKSIGIITLGLVVSGQITDFHVPLWVMAVSGLAIVAGTLSGSWRLIRTLGSKFYKIRPIHGFCTQAASAAVILAAAAVGGPASTTQVVSSAILGVGSAQRFNMVRWNVAGQIAVAWLLTIPVTAFLSAGITLLLRFLNF